VYGYNRHVPVALAACLVSALGAVLLAASGPIYRTGLVGLESAFQLLRWAAYLGVAGIAIALIAGAIAYFRGGRTTQLLAGLAFVVGLVAFAIPYQWQRSARALPPIHDITTDLENPPVFEAVVPLRADAANSLERPPELARQQREGYPDLEPITVPIPREQAFDKALAEAQAEGWQIVTADKSMGRIEATDTTRWFGFKDDIVVRLTAWGAGTRVDVRSVSRIGRGDVGTNAARIRRYLGKLRAG
jgi:uncharacterized protein (DUF1499 family)